MGYTTEFSGELKLRAGTTLEEIRELQTFLGEDPDKHPEWEKVKGNRYSYLQWELTKDFSAIKWDGGEKFYYSVEGLNLIISEMKKKFPEFALSGELEAQGEEIGDCWKLVIDNGVAKRVETPPAGTKVTCPHCDEYFYYEEKA